MITFTTDKPLTNRQFFLSLVPQLALMLIVFIILYFFSSEEKRVTGYLTFSLILLGNVIRLLQADKFEEIRFDEDKRELHFYSKSYFSKLRKIKTSFEGLAVEKEKNSFKVIKRRRKVFRLDQADDSFSEQKMNELIGTFESFNIPVKA